MSLLENAKYQPGDRVRVRIGSPPRHIRTPAYIQGKPGWIEALYGAFKNPESLAYGGSGLKVKPLYRVRFQQTDVWKNYGGSPRDKLCVDIYEHWLKPA